MILPTTKGKHMPRFIHAIVHPSPRPCEHHVIVNLVPAQKHVGRCCDCNLTVAKFGASK